MNKDIHISLRACIKRILAASVAMRMACQSRLTQFCHD